MRSPRERLPTIDQEGQKLVERLGGRWTSKGGMCRCPAHDDRTPSLSVRPGRTRLLLHCFAGCAAADILRTLQSGGLLVANRGGADSSAGPGEGRRDAAAQRLWNDSRSIAGTPASSYLAARALGGAPAELRYHPRTPAGASPLTRFRPALIAAVRDDCGLVGIHRTFLDSRRPGVAAARAGLGSFGRGAVRLGGIAPRLGLAEGIETALSATALFGLPCWASLGAERLRLVRIPANVRELVLFLDNDRAGRRAECHARAAFAHVTQVQIQYAERPGGDWNDVLRAVRSGAAD